MKIKPQIEDHYKDALTAYAKECERKGIVMNQPSEANSTIDAVYVNLKNSNGIVAKFNWKSGKLLNN